MNAHPLSALRGAWRRPLCLVGGGGLLFGLTLLSVATGVGVNTWDGPVHAWFLEHRSDAVTWLWACITTLSSPMYLTVIGLVLAALWAVVGRQWWRPTLLLASMGGTVALSALIKHLVARPRPDPAGFLLGPDDALSFPSGHTLGATVFVLVLGYLLLSRPAPAWHRTAVVGAGVVLIPAVAISRLYLGYHWLSDVVGSVTLALAVLGVVMLLDTWPPLHKWSRAAPRPTGWPGRDR